MFLFVLSGRGGGVFFLYLGRVGFCCCYCLFVVVVFLLFFFFLGGGGVAGGGEAGGVIGSVSLQLIRISFCPQRHACLKTML